MLSLLDKIYQRLKTVHPTTARPTAPPFNRPEFETLVRSWDPNHLAPLYDHWYYEGAQNGRGVPVIFVNNGPVPVVRALFDTALGEPMHKSWRVKRMCNDGTCCNPLHYGLRATYRHRELPTQPLPARAFVRPLKPTQSEDFEILVDMILMVEGQTDDPESFRARNSAWEDYDPETIKRAQAHIREQGL